MESTLYWILPSALCSVSPESAMPPPCYSKVVWWLCSPERTRTRKPPHIVLRPQPSVPLAEAVPDSLRVTCSEDPQVATRQYLSNLSRRGAKHDANTTYRS